MSNTNINTLLVEALFSTTICVLFNSDKTNPPSYLQIQKEEKSKNNLNQQNVIQPSLIKNWEIEVKKKILNNEKKSSILRYDKNAWEEGLSLNLSKFLLKENKEYQNYSGISYAFNKEIVTFEPIVIDIEPSNEQYIYGFYFPCTNITMQILMDITDPVEYYMQIQTSMRTFFENLRTMCLEIEEKKALTNSVIPIIIGFNHVLYDLAIIQVFLSVVPSICNPLVEAELYSKAVISTGGKGINRRISYFDGIFLLDLHWLRAGNLNKWILEMKTYSIFSSLLEKKGNRPKGRLFDVKLQNWLNYNVNDLLSTYFLCLYKHNIFNSFLNAYARYNEKKNQVTFSECLLERKFMYLKDSFIAQ